MAAGEGVVEVVMEVIFGSREGGGGSKLSMVLVELVLAVIVC